ncbi:MAG: hypothetical protein COU27_02265 [Candidatus Levybacteria bacterium CG10_big_fil_rev_8_21_14_0_10_36_7]|nr:MAG: hypothetical protein COU27_02265 [Candidatus Levybacteria bacterium CG10_big_fil_rev_8_21_14_0_10_36_7]
MENVREIKFKKSRWIHFDSPNHESIEYLRKKYPFSNTLLQDSLSSSHRTKIESYPDYLYFVIILPLYSRNIREIHDTKFNFFIGKDYIISFSHEHCKVFHDFFNLFYENKNIRDGVENSTPEGILHELLDKLYHSSMPIIDHIISDSDKIEKAIFSRKENKMISEILLVRRNITDFRQIMQGHKDIIKKLITTLKDNPLYYMKKTDITYNNLIEHAKEIWNNLEILKERIEALQQTNESQISFLLSDIMKTLTIISVITFPITLIAGIFGMNTIKAMPFIEHQHGFWIIIGLMIMIVVAMLSFFKKKGWM